ncbi:MAG: RNA methyltransferase [Bacteroidales bacterium]|nr:RNA methyltransferase [Bacteroidales bacterium]
MISKNQIQHIKSLSINKFRKIHNKFIVEGPKIIDELINSPFNVKGIFAQAEWININGSALTNDTSITEVSEKELNRISNLKNPNQVLAVVDMAENIQPDSNTFNDLVLILDDISDPGNMGTIIRTADWFGIKQIICSDSCVDIYNSKVVQATMGSLFRVSVYYTNLKNYLEKLPPGQNIYGTLLDGENIYQASLTNKGFILIGNESRGISKDLITFITHKLTIPNYSYKPLDTAESLNASVATAIVCAEFRRQSN